jgi:hypothetical protein
MSEYRENDDNIDVENLETPTEETQETQESSEADFNPTNVDLNENEIVDDEVVTAVLLVKNKQGAVLPVTNLQSLKMERQANAHEVLRMCADVQDQISAIRVVGELAQIFQHINQESLSSIAKLMNVKMNQNVGASETES